MPGKPNPNFRVDVPSWAMTMERMTKDIERISKGYTLIENLPKEGLRVVMTILEFHAEYCYFANKSAPETAFEDFFYTKKEGEKPIYDDSLR